MAGHLLALLEGVAAGPGVPVRGLGMLTAAERGQLAGVERDRGAGAAGGRGARAGRGGGGAVPGRGGGERPRSGQLTYAGLVERAGRLAAVLCRPRVRARRRWWGCACRAGSDLVTAMRGGVVVRRGVPAARPGLPGRPAGVHAGRQRARRSWSPPGTRTRAVRRGPGGDRGWMTRRSGRPLRAAASAAAAAVHRRAAGVRDLHLGVDRGAQGSAGRSRRRGEPGGGARTARLAAVRGRDGSCSSRRSASTRRCWNVVATLAPERRWWWLPRRSGPSRARLRGTGRPASGVRARRCYRRCWPSWTSMTAVPGLRHADCWRARAADRARVAARLRVRPRHCSTPTGRPRRPS